MQRRLALGHHRPPGRRDGRLPPAPDEQDLRLTTATPIPLPTGRTTLVFTAEVPKRWMSALGDIEDYDWLPPDPLSTSAVRMSGQFDRFPVQVGTDVNSITGGTGALDSRSSEDIEPGFDLGRVEVSGNDGAFLPVAIYTGLFAGQRNVDLSGFGGQDVRLRFRFLSDEVISAPVHQGWFVDDLRLESSNRYRRDARRVDRLVQRGGQRRPPAHARAHELRPRRRALRGALRRERPLLELPGRHGAAAGAAADPPREGGGRP